MNSISLIKSSDFFNPQKLGSDACHIIGCGSVGSAVAELLARFGITNINLYDFDKVEAKNIANQMFFDRHIGKLKTDCVKEIICEINPVAENKIKTFNNGYEMNIPLNGYVFLCVDDIELRKKIVEKHRYNPSIKAMFDFRTMLTSAQHYAADWKNDDSITRFLSTMQFTHEEATQETPTSACGIVLGVAPTVRNIAAYGVCNFVNFINENKLAEMIISDSFKFEIISI